MAPPPSHPHPHLTPPPPAAQVPGATWTYLSAAAGTALGAYTGTTPLIIAAESAVGIKEGGRTGLVAVTVAACFGISMLLAPLLQVGSRGGRPAGSRGGGGWVGRCVCVEGGEAGA